MKTKTLIIIGISVTVFLMGIIAYQTTNKVVSYDDNLIATLKQIRLNPDSIGGDIHYEKVDKEGNFWGTINKINLLDDETIEVTFNANNYKLEYIHNDVPMVYKVPEFEYVTKIKKNQTFAPLCLQIGDGKTLIVLKYTGITEQNGTQYYTFWHKNAENIEINCKYPDIIKDSLSVNFDFGEEPWHKIWNHD